MTAGSLTLLVRLVLFLIGQTLGEADSWMSIAGGLAALAGAAVGLVGWLLHRGRSALDEETSLAGRIAGWEASRLAYGTAVRRRYQTIDLEVLTPLSEQDEHPPLRLGEIFVGQLVKSDPPAVELPRELMLRLAQDDLQELRDLPPDIDRTLLAEVRSAYTQRAPSPVLELLAGEGTRLVLLGDPGAGKTTLTKYVVYTLSGQVQPTDPLAPLAGWLPLIVELREFSRVLSADPWDAFARYWQQRHAEGTGLPPDELARHLLADGRAVVFFDGLDEVFEPELRDRVERHIVGFADTHPRARVVVTSRPVGYQGDNLRAAGFAKAKIQDLDKEQIREFVTRWYQVTCRAEPVQGEQLANRLLKAIGNSAAVAEVAGNPMLLTILAIIGRRRALPRDRSSVFEHAVTVMVEHWDPSKFLNQELPSANLPYLDATDKLELLRLVARRMQDSPAGLSGNFISGHDLTSEFAEFLRERDPGHVPLDKAKQAAAYMLQQFRDRNFILSRFGGNVYGFVHRSFLEYLAAADIVDRFHRTRELTEDQLVNDVFLRRWRDPAWHEVLLLITGMLGESTAELCILGLLDQDPRWGVRQDVPPTHLTLAVRCLAEVRRLSRLTVAGPATLRHVIHALEMFSLSSRHNMFGGRALTAVCRIVVPTIAGLGTTLPGWEAYLSWFRRRRLSLTYGSAAPAAELANAYREPDANMDHLVELATQHPTPMVRQEAFEILKSQNRQPVLLADMRDVIAREPEPYGRAAAISVIGSGWRGDPDALAFLRDIAIGDDDGRVRAAAVDVIEVGWQGDPAAFALLRDLAANVGDSRVRCAAVSAIGSGWQDHPEASALVRRIALADDDVNVRVTAVQTLDTGWPEDANAFPLLFDLVLNGGEASLRAASVMAISAPREDQDVLGLLRRLATEDVDAEVRRSALIAIRQAWLDDPSTLQLASEIAARDSDGFVRSAATSIMGRCGKGSAEALASLHGMVSNDGDAIVRQAAMRAIVQGWPTDPGTLSMLCDRALNDDDWWTQVEAVNAMATDWPGDARTLPVLQRLSTVVVSPEPFASVGTTIVSSAAIRAVAAGWSDDRQTRVMLRGLAVKAIDESDRTNALVLLAMGWWDDPSTLPLLRDLAQTGRPDSIREVAQAAVAVVKAIVPPHSAERAPRQ